MLNTLLVASLISSTGNSSLLGRPPAKEMTDGSRATLSISRMKERGTSVIRSENMLSAVSSSMGSRPIVSVYHKQKIKQISRLHRLFHVADQIIDLFNPHGQPQQ